MPKEYLYGLIGLILGVVITTFVASNAVNSNNTQMMGMMGMNTRGGMMDEVEDEGGDGQKMGMDSSMNKMMKSLEDKSGDNFDKTFMDNMMIHHQGAIEMARQAKTSSNRPEIQKMADDIISAQTGEIDMMRNWQKEWGF